MDRRQRKTREAIFDAFTRLLAHRVYHQITVQDIIDGADVGRATFYAHFETKDYLLKALCEELFGHVIDTAMGALHGHYHCPGATAEDSVFLHLLRHLQENDRNILALLSSQNNEIFIRYFKENLAKLVEIRFAAPIAEKALDVPGDYALNHMAASFVETVSWWLRRGMKESPEELNGYFETVMKTVLDQ